MQGQSLKDLATLKAKNANVSREVNEQRVHIQLLMGEKEKIGSGLDVMNVATDLQTLQQDF
eukprot:7547646-Prorocentrum_lima.AAC.1